MVTPLALIRTVAVATLAATAALGCDAKSDTPQSGQQEAVAQTPTAGDQAEADPDAPRYDVHVEVPSKAPPGQEALAKVHVEPRKPWHMNTKFPVALRIEATAGVTVDVPSQRKGDAERFDDDGLVFALPFTPTSDGTKRIAGEVDFAVCGDAACAPETVPVDFTVEVGCDSGALC